MDSCGPLGVQPVVTMASFRCRTITDVQDRLHNQKEVQQLIHFIANTDANEQWPARGYQTPPLFS